ncbi:MAG: DUF6512 family protein [Lachnospiraceae bacterium]|nr:DUF6512 family protein [Lachnospiraceae bacterium]
MNSLKHTLIIGVAIVSLLGTLSHFIYELSGNNFILGFFFSTNESTWEHMKIFYFPMLIYSIYLIKKYKPDHPCIASALWSGILIGIITIPILFYTYSGILGRTYTAVDILIYYIAVTLAFFTTYRFTTRCKMQPYTKILTCLIILLSLAFLIFTYQTPNLGIFQNPI